MDAHAHTQTHTHRATIDTSSDSHDLHVTEMQDKQRLADAQTHRDTKTQTGTHTDKNSRQPNTDRHTDTPGYRHRHRTTARHQRAVICRRQK